MYTAHLSDFHNSRITYRGASFAAALKHTTCAADCTCGGGYVMHDGDNIDLYALPDAVLDGAREPTPAEMAAACAEG